MLYRVTKNDNDGTKTLCYLKSTDLQMVELTIKLVNESCKDKGFSYSFEEIDKPKNLVNTMKLLVEDANKKEQ